ncbi:hypothetical protein BN7_6066 [Wickerhamomyces ciferrii]|uniref:Uncharacterized protein n=1 Tax=Wickerhamomyces ciferrii (strain ATCC 14091 / BCRC 22168 / CBS 111 / JCM 3599 / NBRC 0793 / NRRL Y-1031 F-60-10) TaxID=1206466 RepID=K0KZB3_WICCF|nr:uncharacterized protein BN7_6066 [Wickerhamomyces ciferrii]CCH46473.1 hypothetical protein BN7_6066 [Wickerhamomyces ciferrii]
MSSKGTAAGKEKVQIKKDQEVITTADQEVQDHPSDKEYVKDLVSLKYSDNLEAPLIYQDNNNDRQLVNNKAANNQIQKLCNEILLKNVVESSSRNIENLKKDIISSIKSYFNIESNFQWKSLADTDSDMEF